jgi:hypothetical protein
MARSPVAVGIVLGLLVGAAGVAALASTSSSSETAASPPKVAIPPRVTVSPTTATTVGGPLNTPSSLPELAGEARGYRLGSEPAAGALERLAAAFDMHAPVQTDAGGWVVRDGNHLLRVQRSAGLPWFFSTLDGPCKLVPESPPSSEPLQTVPPSGPSDCPDATPPAAAPDLVVSQDDALAARRSHTDRRAALDRHRRSRTHGVCGQRLSGQTGAGRHVPAGGRGQGTGPRPAGGRRRHDHRCPPRSDARPCGIGAVPRARLPIRARGRRRSAADRAGSRHRRSLPVVA